MQNLHTLFVGHHIKREGFFTHSHHVRLLLRGQVPAQLIEKRFEAELPQMIEVEVGHVISSGQFVLPGGSKPNEHTTRGSRSAASSSA